jgi:Type I phosphodiesterase / nucleotide pyrophosphatase
MAQLHKIHVFVLIDALGWECIKERPFLNTELPFRKPLKTVLGYSSGAIPTILTGLSPAQTGHWNLLYYDPMNSPFHWLRWLSILPDRLVNSTLSREFIKQLGRRLLGMGPLFECCVRPTLLPWFNWIEKKNIYAEGGITGSKNIFDVLRARNIPYRVYSYHDMSDAEILIRAREDVQSSPANFFFLYLCQMDALLHGQCNNWKALTTQLTWYQNQLRQVFVSARQIDPNASFTVMSDHGMTLVHSNYDLVSRIDKLGFTMPEQYLSVYDSTMARFWFFDNRARQAILEELESTTCGRILKDDELEEVGILFPDRRYGELIFLLDPGWLLTQSDFNGPRWNPVGMHGYHPCDCNSDAIFLSNRTPNHKLESIQDIYQCLEDAATAA